MQRRMRQQFFQTKLKRHVFQNNNGLYLTHESYKGLTIWPERPHEDVLFQNIQHEQREFDSSLHD